MKTTLIPTILQGVYEVKIDCFKDERGFFIEAYNKRDFIEAGLNIEILQYNHSRSGAKVLRGLHYQDMTAPMGKLVRCIMGSILDIAVDLRVDSPTFGKWVGVELSAENMKQLWVPAGFAHGFATLSKIAEVQYGCTGYYTPNAEGAVVWNDPDIGIEWPYKDPVLSQKDSQALTLKEYLKKPAFFYKEFEREKN